MPARVKRVRWKCEQCGKSAWLVPSIAATKRYCSNACKGLGRRVEKPVRPKQSAKPVYPKRPCEHCRVDYKPTTLHQRFCSMQCSGASRKGVRRGQSLEPRLCENCGTEFVPRDGSAGRFCSWDCKNQGQRGARASGWKGGRSIASSGYVSVWTPDHPNANRTGYVLEHRLVMQHHLGRPLERHETIHHINGDKADNRIENLQLRSGRHGKGSVYRCKDCGSHNVEAVPLN